MSDSSSVDWSRVARIALVVPGDSPIDDEFRRLLAGLRRDAAQGGRLFEIAGA